MLRSYHQISSLLLLCGLLLTSHAETLEIVKLYLPLHLEGTQTSAINQHGESIDHMICPTPLVISGAMPEELLLAHTRPYKIPSVSDRYLKQEANLFVCHQIKLNLSSESKDSMKVELICQKEKPSNIDITKLFPVLVKSLRLSLQNYYRDSQIEMNVQVLMSHEKLQMENSFRL